MKKKGYSMKSAQARPKNSKTSSSNKSGKSTAQGRTSKQPKGYGGGRKKGY